MSSSSVVQTAITKNNNNIAPTGITYVLAAVGRRSRDGRAARGPKSEQAEGRRRTDKWVPTATVARRVSTSLFVVDARRGFWTLVRIRREISKSNLTRFRIFSSRVLLFCFFLNLNESFPTVQDFAASSNRFRTILIIARRMIQVRQGRRV